MKVLIACEESQTVCKAFRKLGHEAYSCDTKDCSGGHPEWHIKGNVLDIIYDGWDLLIGHPPCTYISYAGVAHWNKPGRLEKRLDALAFFAKLWNAPIERICLENPKGCASPTIAKYSQEIQPYYFGEPQLKTTWIWLKGLPKLKWSQKDDLFSLATSSGKPEPLEIQIRKPSKNYNGGELKKRYFTDAGTKDSQRRSKTFQGIADAMAIQWGGDIRNFNPTNL